MGAIIITTDFSAGSKQVAHYGFELAKQLKVDVMLCNALIISTEIPQMAFVGWPPDVFEGLMEDSITELSKLKQDLVSVKSATDDEFKPAISFVSQVGTVCDVVGQVINLRGADLVLLGSHKNKGLGQWIIGNHSRRLIDNCNIPLLLVPNGARFRKIKKIAFATDFNDMQADLNCIRKMGAIAKLLNAGILLIHVNDEKHNILHLECYLDEALKEMVEKNNYLEIDYRLIRGSRTMAGLDWLSEQDDVDILAMVHRSHGFFASLFKSSYTQKIADHMNIPLLVFPDRLSV